MGPAGVSRRCHSARQCAVLPEAAAPPPVHSWPPQQPAPARGALNLFTINSQLDLTDLTATHADFQANLGRAILGRRALPPAQTLLAAFPVLGSLANQSSVG